MDVRIEIREGPPSRENEEAIFYVVLIADGREKLLAGPATEGRAIELAEHIALGRIDTTRCVRGGPELPPPGRAPGVSGSTWDGFTVAMFFMAAFGGLVALLWWWLS
jgi:hypothetical protein